MPIFLLDAVRDRVPALDASPSIRAADQTGVPRKTGKTDKANPITKPDQVGSPVLPPNNNPILPDYFNARRWADSPDFNRRFDVVVGNPPWIAWDRLSAEYRDATKERWRERGLFTLSGSAALLGGGKKELAGLLVYETLDRRLRDGGVLAFVVPKSLFQSRDAGNGFRRFGGGCRFGGSGLHRHGGGKQHQAQK